MNPTNVMYWSLAAIIVVGALCVAALLCFLTYFTIKKEREKNDV